EPPVLEAGGEDEEKSREAEETGEHAPEHGGRRSGSFEGVGEDGEYGAVEREGREEAGQLRAERRRDAGEQHDEDGGGGQARRPGPRARGPRGVATPRPRALPGAGGTRPPRRA